MKIFGMQLSKAITGDDDPPERRGRWPSNIRCFLA